MMADKKEDNKVAKRKTRAGRPKTGGLQKGGRIIKVETVGMENTLRLFINQKFPAAIKAWESIEDPADKVNTFIKLLEFVLPKKRAIDFKSDDATTLTLEKRLAKLLYAPADVEDVEDVENVDDAEEKSSL